MLRTLTISVLCAPLLAACASERTTSIMRLSANIASLEVIDQVPDLQKKTPASRILAAIALERVTGLKPDPARFVQP